MFGSKILAPKYYPYYNDKTSILKINIIIFTLFKHGQIIKFVGNEFYIRPDTRYWQNIQPEA